MRLTPVFCLLLVSSVLAGGCFETSAPTTTCGPGTVNVQGVCVLQETPPNGSTVLDAYTAPAADGTQVTSPEVEEDPSELQCEPGISHSKPVGAACERHCECQTDYCYDEAYLGTFRFCTRDCDGGCDGDTVGLDQYRCLLLGGFAADYDLTHTSICQKICQSLEDCKALASAYDQCGSTSGPGTQWDSKTLSVEKTCQIGSEVE